MPHTFVCFESDDQVVVQEFGQEPVINPFGRKHPVRAIQNGEQIVESPRYCECGTVSKVPYKDLKGRIISYVCQICTAKTAVEAA